MTEVDPFGRPGGNIPYEASVENDITLATLVHPQGRSWPERMMPYLIARRSEKTPRTFTTNWEPRDLTGEQDEIRYIPMNDCGYAKLEGPGFLTTDHLNGCTVVAAAYRDEQDSVQAFLEHYDLETLRSNFDDNEQLTARNLLAGFAGDNPVKVAIAYSKAHNLAYTNRRTYEPFNYPLVSLIDGCRELPSGSSVLLIPYETSPTNPGHMLYVGRGGADTIYFGWNDDKIDVGEPEPFDETRRSIARRLGGLRGRT